MAQKTSSGERGQVQYQCEKVDAVPDSEFQRGNRYLMLLQPLVDDPGGVYIIATFSTDSGASVVKKALDAGKRKIPEGKWQFDARTFFNGDGKKISRLYATYVGPE